MIRQCTLSEITHNVTDGKHGDCLNEQDSGFYFVSVKDIKSGGIDYHNARQITQRDYIETHKRTRFEAGDILLANSGHTIGKMVYAKDSKYISKTTFQKSVAIIKPDIKKVDGVFLYYNLLANVKGLRRAAVGSAQPNLLLRDLRSFKLDIYKDVNYQSQIAKVLSNLDAKIELNNKINAELEAMAKLIYDYWFVQFDFPDENGKPYKSSGGLMVYNEELKREIPEGWEVSYFGTIVQQINDNIEPNEYPILPYLPIDKLPTKRLYYDEYESRNEANSSLLRFKEDDILLGAMRVYFHRVCNAIEDGISRSTMMVLRPKDVLHKNYSLFTLNREEAIKYATKNSTGSSIPYAKWNNGLEKYKVCVTNDITLFEEFNKIVDPILGDFKILSKQNQKLAELRDWLLPMLMNGQVRVK
jgi:type I restriction enzyme S subunit